jgi:hypothetical protein
VCGTAPARVAGMHQPPPQRLCPEYPPPAHAALTTAAVRGRREPGERYANEVCTGVQRRCGCWACAHLRTTQRAHPGGRFHTALQRRARRSGRGARHTSINFPFLIILSFIWLSHIRWAVTCPPSRRRLRLLRADAQKLPTNWPHTSALRVAASSSVRCGATVAPAPCCGCRCCQHCLLPASSRL